MSPDKIKNKYEKRILAVLDRIKNHLQENSTLTVEGPYEMHDDEYRWALFIVSPEDRKTNTENNVVSGIDLRFEILESEQNDGELGGVNFCIEISSVEGEVLGGYCPFNYTDRVWVPRNKLDEIEERFCLVESADEAGVLQVLKDYYEENLEKDCSKLGANK